MSFHRFSFEVTRLHEVYHSGGRWPAGLSPSPGTCLGAGTGEKLSVIFTSADTADYPSVTDAVSINVTSASPTLTPTPTPKPTPTTKLGILVPAYIYPGTGGPNGVGDGWDDLIAAASQVSLTVILNLAGGPASAYRPQ